MGRARGGGPKGLSTAETNARSLGSSPPCPPRKAGRVNRSPQSGEGHRMTGGAVSPLPIHGEGQGGEAQRPRCGRAKRKRPRFVPTLPSPQSGEGEERSAKRGGQSDERLSTNGRMGSFSPPHSWGGPGWGGPKASVQPSKTQEASVRPHPALPAKRGGGIESRQEG